VLGGSAIHPAVDVSRINQVGSKPAVEVVLGHEAVDKFPQRIRIARGERGRQVFEPDIFIVARVVALVQLVASTELGADSIS